MRSKSAGFVLLLALGVAVTATVTGQEEPALSPVHSRLFASVEPSLTLAVEPVRHTASQQTLADAVRRNDYVTFHALYEESKPAAYRTLHDLWTWAINDPVGAFYGRDTYERLARAYPGYTSYIETYRIVDSHGNVFYPTSETRMFLLQRAMVNESPTVMIAGPTKSPRNVASDATTATATTPTKSATPRHRTTTRATNTPSTNTTAATNKPAHTSTAPVAQVSKSHATANAATTKHARADKPTDKPAARSENPATKPLASTASTTASTQPSTTRTTSSSTKPSPTTSTTVLPTTDNRQPTTNVQTTTVQPTTNVQPPTANRQPPTTPTTNPVPAQPPADARTPNSGILLLVIGLIGVGLLAVILRTPREAQPTSIIHPQGAAPDAAPNGKTDVKHDVPMKSDANRETPVEPLRRPATQATEESKKPRANGSRG